MSDSYRTVTVRIEWVRANSIIVQPPHMKATAVIPRSLIHYADDRNLSDIVCPVVHTFRVREWKAEELGLAG